MVLLCLILIVVLLVQGRVFDLGPVVEAARDLLLQVVLLLLLGLDLVGG